MSDPEQLEQTLRQDFESAWDKMVRTLGDNHIPKILAWWMYREGRREENEACAKVAEYEGASKFTRSMDGMTMSGHISAKIRARLAEAPAHGC